MDHAPPLESSQNPRFKLWESLLDGRGIRKAGRFLLAGRKAAPEALARWPDRFSEVLADSAEALAGWTLPPGVRPVLLAPALFRRLDVSGTRAPILVGAVPDMPKADLSAPPRGVELVCALGDPANLGALLRSAAAFGVARVILLEEAAHPFHPKCLRASANASLALDLRRGGGWADLRAAAGPLVALDAGGEDVTAVDLPADLRLVLGEEGPGVPPDLSARRLSIPTTGAVESLNATVAAGVALSWLFTRRRVPPAPPNGGTPR